MYKANIKLSDYALLLVMTCLISCNSLPERPAEPNERALQFTATNEALVEAFDWAKDKALSYAHDGSDPVGYWYEAALPNREAFCMRDVSHQAIGAEILGLSKHNYNMYLKFAQNISAAKDYCTYWEINRYDQPAPVDYESDQDFWYNLPANFDVTYSAYRLYKWTGNKDYLENPDLKKFYDLSLNEYIDHWALGSSEILQRDRAMHLDETVSDSRFGKNRGIPTYNEGGRGETFLGIDMTASIIAAYKAYSAMLELSGETEKATAYKEKTRREQAFLEDFWWDKEKQAYRSILYEDETFDYFMVGDNQAFLHYLIYFDVISDQQKLSDLVKAYDENFDKLIVELKSYLPIIFYEHGYTERANQMIIDLCDEKNQRRDYPENSYTVIEHLTRGLMGIDVDATTNTFSTVSRVDNNEDWAAMENIPLLSNLVSVKHYGKEKTVAANVSGSPINWSAAIPGTHEFLYVDGRKTKCTVVGDDSQPYSSCMIELDEGDEITVSVNP